MNTGIHPSAIIEGHVSLGVGSSVGYYSIVRGHVTAGRNLRLGALSSIEGEVTIGDDVTIRGKCEIPTSIIGDRVQIYCGVRFLDTPNPAAGGPNLPPTIEDDVTIGVDALILGGITVGARSFIGAGVFLRESVPPDSWVTAQKNYTVRSRHG